MLSFAQPFFLFALGGLVVPFLIHRISKSRPIAWNFPSIARIRSTPLPRQGSRAISDWPLLFLRTLILALFILALAGPSWTPNADQSGASKEAKPYGTIVLDFSSSMSGWDAISDTKKLLRELDAEPYESWKWLVINHPDDQRRDGYPTGESIPELLNFLSQNRPTFNAMNTRQGLIRAIEMVGAHSDQSQHLHLISDFQESNWSDRLPEIPSGVEIRLHRVGLNSRNFNLGIQDVIVVPSENERLRVICRVVNFGNTPLTAEMRLTTTDETASARVTLEPRSPYPVVFEIAAPSASTDASVEIFPLEGKDPYVRDNQVTFRASAPAPLEVLALLLDPISGKDSGEIFFLKQALDTESSSEWLRYALLDVGAFAIEPQNLSQTSAVFIPAGAFGDPSVPWGALVDYIESGGLVVATMGKNAVRGFQSLQAQEYPTGKYIGLAGRSRSERFFVGSLPKNSPLSTVFEGPSARDLHLMSISRYVRMSLPQESSLLLATEKGFPLIATIPHGEGSLVLSTFPWDRSASDFPLRPSFLPIVREVFALGNDKAKSTQSAKQKPPAPLEESVTEFVPAEEIMMQLAGQRTSSSDRTDRPQVISDQSQATPLTPWLLLAAIFVFALESILARQLIRSSIPSP